MSQQLISVQNKVLQALANKIDDFYLVGGTALSLFYFNHRQSEDLDFFTQEFSAVRVRQVIESLSQKINKDIRLLAENLSKNSVEVMVYNFEFAKDKFLKLDFVKDYLPLIKPAKFVNGIKIISLEDIYLRKIFAVSGARIEKDETGRTRALGGRQEAKDLFDIYFLSHTFMGLSDFAYKFCDQARKEGLIRWFRTFNRLDIKAGLADIKTDKSVEFKDIDKHIAGQIDKILKKEIA